MLLGQEPTIVDETNLLMVVITMLFRVEQCLLTVNYPEQWLLTVNYPEQWLLTVNYPEQWLLTVNYPEQWLLTGDTVHNNVESC